jgi:hypothetical protein
MNANSTVIFDKPELAKAVHEEANAGTSRMLALDAQLPISPPSAAPSAAIDGFIYRESPIAQTQPVNVLKVRIPCVCQFAARASQRAERK